MSSLFNQLTLLASDEASAPQHDYYIPAPERRVGIPASVPADPTTAPYYNITVAFTVNTGV